MAAPLLPLTLLALAQAAAPPSAATPGPSTNAPAPQPRCNVPTDGNTIVVCAEKPDGYRINPDVMAAKKGNRPDPGPPRSNNLTLRPDCTTVGPAPCMTAGVNLLGMALTAAQMAQRVAKGQEIGSMFKTTPSPNEYQRYLIAKAQREAQEQAEAAAKAKAKAVAAAQAAKQDAAVPPAK